MRRSPVRTCGQLAGVRLVAASYSAGGTTQRVVRTCGDEGSAQEIRTEAVMEAGAQGRRESDHVEWQITTVQAAIGAAIKMCVGTAASHRRLYKPV